MTSICIVGHGTSMLDKKLGSWIDSHDEVIRLKQHIHLMALPEHFGTKRTVHGYSFVLADMLYKQFPCRQWIWFDGRNNFGTDPQSAREKYPDAMIYPELIQEWIRIYRGLRKEFELDDHQDSCGKLSDGLLGHGHFSQGLLAVLYTLEFFHPDKISLPGFDNLLSGTFNESLAFRPWDKTGTKYPDHNWQAECQTLEKMLAHYGASIEDEP